MNIPFTLLQIGHLGAALLFGWCVLWNYQWIRRRSQQIGNIVAVGILVRIGFGLALFWVSFLRLPIASHLQVSGGFWDPAADAKGYWEFAAAAAEAGQFAQNPALPSPFFIQTLAMWMGLVGISPAAGVFLNLCLYAVVVRTLVWCFDPVNDWRRDLPCIVGVAAYSFSPVVLIHSTQPLKDVLSHTLIAMMCLSVLGIARLVRSVPRASSLSTVALSAIIMAAATYGIAGIRWYYAFLMWGTLALVLALFIVRGRSTPILRYLTGSVSVLAVVWLGFWAGAGPFYELVGTRAAELPSQLSNLTQVARMGFLMSGGATNVVVPLRPDSDTGRNYQDRLIATQHASAAYVQRNEQQQAGALSSKKPASPLAPGQVAVDAPKPVETGRPRTPERVLAQAEAARAIPVTSSEHLRVIATGVGTIFVPPALLKAISGIAIPGGLGLLAVVDIDTIFQDAAILVVLALLWRRRQLIGDRLPFVAFGLVLASASAMLLGYVVTNFGTLWRLRTLMAIPIWLLVAALSPKRKP